MSHNFLFDISGSNNDLSIIVDSSYSTISESQNRLYPIKIPPFSESSFTTSLILDSLFIDSKDRLIESSPNIQS